MTVKTSVSSQISAIRNVVSSYEIEIKENQINWVQLDPFFAVARLQKQNSGQYSVVQLAGRSGTMAERWSPSFLEKALAVGQSKSDKAIQARLFKDRAGGKYLILIFNSQSSNPTAVIGMADYFQKYFDLERGGRMTSALLTSNQMLAGHTESDYIATVSDEAKLSPQKYILAQDEIAGTNLSALSYISKKSVASSWMVPWSVIGLISGFGFVLIGLLFYGLDPLEKKVERYRKQERENIFKDMVQSEIKSNEALSEHTTESLSLVDKSKEDTVNKAQEAFSEPEGELAEATLNGPLQQAIFNLDSVFKHAHITIEKDISTRLSHSFYYGHVIKAFENILRNCIEALSEKKTDRRITIRGYDIESNCTVIEIQDNGMGLAHLETQVDKIWQPFFTTKSKSHHMGLGLTEALSIFRRCGADLILEPLLPEGVLVKMIMRKENEIKIAEETPEVISKKSVEFAQPAMGFTEDLVPAATIAAEPAADDELDLDQVLSLDDSEVESIFTSQKVNLKETQSTGLVPASAPQFEIAPKEYGVDLINVSIRRPSKR